MKPSILLLTISGALMCQLSRAQDITWADDVACVIYNNCVKCHNPSGVAPFSLLTYEQAFEKRILIGAYVEARLMPPWPASGGTQDFVNDNRLTEEEVATITGWVDAGAPSGDLSQAPSVPVIPEGDEIENPDLVVQMETYTSQAGDHDDYRCFVIPTNFAEDRYVNSFEVVPGNKNIVHHVILFEDVSQTVQDLDALDPLPGYTCFGGTGSFQSSVVAGWVPGQTSRTMPEGTGILLPAGTNLVIQTHYPEGTEGMLDSTRVNLTFTEDPGSTREMLYVPLLNHTDISLVNGPLSIPAGEVKTYRAEFTTFFKSTVFSVLPHMHLIGTSMKAYGVTLTGDTLHFFDIPDWDFEWQLSYTYRQPVVVPFGTKLVAEATYDNTNNNPNNPSNPPVDVMQGEATTDEMLLVFFEFALYQDGDEDMVFADAPPLSEECQGTSTSRGIPADLPITVFPNPAADRIHIQGEVEGAFSVTLRDLSGRVLVSAENRTRLDVSGIPR
ncbi:MAG: hypothetical protein R3301_19420, partial [Saprospiraceae bacterium]|nr:hypothetical protein [Saprospiraceae bacterium]